MTEELTKWETKYEKEIGEKDEEIKKASHEHFKIMEKLNGFRERKIEEIKTKKEEEELKIFNDGIDLTKASKNLREYHAAKIIQKYLKLYILHNKKHYVAVKKTSKKGKEGDKKGKKK